MHEAVKSARDLKKKNAELAARLNVSEEQIRRLREANQKMLFNEAEVLAAIESADAALANRTTTISAHERKPHTGGRKAIPKEFPRKIIAHDLKEHDKCGLARVALEDYLGKVYGVERKVKELRKAAERSGTSALPDILQLRQTHAVPLMTAFKRWVDDLLPGVSPKTALGKTLAYTTRQWDKLQQFLTDPEMPADNNYCENQIRPFAVGRRAWLFADS